MDSSDYYERALRDARRYRRALIGMLILLVIVLAGLGALAFQIDESNHELLTQIKGIQNHEDSLSTARHQDLLSINNNTNAQVNRLAAEMQCIGEFFTQPNRTNAVISNLQQCDINSVGSPGGAAVAPKVSSPTPAPISSSHENGTTPAAVAPAAPAENPSTSTPAPQPNLLQRVGNILKGLGL